MGSNSILLLGFFIVGEELLCSLCEAVQGGFRSEPYFVELKAKLGWVSIRVREPLVEAEDDGATKLTSGKGCFALEQSDGEVESSPRAAVDDASLSAEGFEVPIVFHDCDVDGCVYNDAAEDPDSVADAGSGSFGFNDVVGAVVRDGYEFVEVVEDGASCYPNDVGGEVVGTEVVSAMSCWWLMVVHASKLRISAAVPPILVGARLCV